MKKFIITAEVQKEIERLWKKPLSELTDNDAIEIVENYVDVEVESAYFMTEDEIWYEEPEEEDEEEDAPHAAFTEEYLNYIGMSMRDFI